MTIWLFMVSEVVAQSQIGELLNHKVKRSHPHRSCCVCNIYCKLNLFESLKPLLQFTHSGKVDNYTLIASCRVT